MDSYLLELPEDEMQLIRDEAKRLNMTIKAYLSRCVKLMTLVEKASVDGELKVRNGQGEFSVWLL